MLIYAKYNKSNVYLKKGHTNSMYKDYACVQLTDGTTSLVIPFSFIYKNMLEFPLYSRANCVNTKFGLLFIDDYIVLRHFGLNLIKKDNVLTAVKNDIDKTQLLTQELKQFGSLISFSNIVGFTDIKVNVEGYKKMYSVYKDIAGSHIPRLN